MSTISDKILNTIKGEHIKPKPRWQFLLQRWLIWIATCVSVIIGSASFSVLFFNLVNNDWEIPKYLGRPTIVHFFNTLPYIWLAVLVLFVGLAYYNVRHTKGAYKYHAYYYVAGSILASVIIGSFFYAVGIGPRVHILTKQVPFMQQLMHDREQLWRQPEKGLIAGEIESVLSGVGLFTLEDFDNTIWLVRPADDFIPPPPQFTIEPGVWVRIIGEQVEEEIFEAEQIMPYYIGPGAGGPGMKGRSIRPQRMNQN